MKTLTQTNVIVKAPLTVQETIKLIAYEASKLSGENEYDLYCHIDASLEMGVSDSWERVGVSEFEEHLYALSASELEEEARLLVESFAEEEANKAEEETEKAEEEREYEAWYAQWVKEEEEEFDAN